MEYRIQHDGSEQPYIEWRQAVDANGKAHVKRAWIRHSTAENDWADVGRYLHVARVENGKVNASPDFPVFSDLTDEQILVAFVVSLNGIIGCVPREAADT